jgi:uncharacterized protein (TIGR02145 family)
MKNQQKLFICLVFLIGVLLSFFSSCEKDNNNSDNSFTDPRDGNVYKTVTIGNQVWMAENLKYLPSVVGPGMGSITIPCYYVYGYDGTNISDAKATANYNTYGVLYNWVAVQEACPAGWHLPSDAEWTQLTDYLGGAGVASGKLKETGTAHWLSPNTGATNEVNFTALPGGGRYGIAFYYIGGNGCWWSSTDNGTDEVWSRLLYFDYGGVGREANSKWNAFSIRCLKD